MSSYDARITAAVKHFWKTRGRQSAKQGTTTGRRDTGARSAVTGGKQMDGFVELVRDLLLGAGLPDDSIHHNSRLELPG